METDSKQVPILKIGLQKINLRQYVQKNELLWKSPLFTGLDEATKSSLLESGQVRSAKSKEIILEQEPSREIFMVMDGSVILSAQDETVDLGPLTNGDFFGLTAVFKNALVVRAKAGPEGARLAIFSGEKITYLATSIVAFGKNLAYRAKERSERAREYSDFMDNW